LTRLRRALLFGAWVGLCVICWHLIFLVVGALGGWVAASLNVDFSWGLNLVLAAIGFAGGSVYWWLRLGEVPDKQRSPT
jgi:membrane protein DedA with SNARE-associated domain